MSSVTELAARWESDAEMLETYKDGRGAELCRQFAAELREAMRAEENEVLTLAQAALESGYSESHLRHEVASGEIPNAGRTGSPRIRRGDLPLKTSKRTNTGPSPEAAADDILGRLGGPNHHN